jgi:hypothetical protein
MRVTAYLFKELLKRRYTSRFPAIILYDEAFRIRMHSRMALHYLEIILPRSGSFDRFDAGSFPALTEGAGRKLK